MKYEYYPKRRTEQERRELNEQILRLLQSGACEQAGLTDEDIFNRYTGDGGLHGLRRSDYDSYNAFSAAKKELENGQFFTPPPLCVRVNTLQTDIGALEEEFSGGGSGAPGRAASSRGSAMERMRKATLEAVRPR